MGKIIYLPLEHIESRYTVHMDRDILKYLEDSGKEYIRIYPDIPSPQTMKAGSFLDAEFTIRFKAAQIAEVARLYREDLIDSGDIVWSSATDPSIGVQWLEVGEGTISITQYFGINETCVIELDVTIMPSSIDLSENISGTKNRR